jgi:FMN phosphatase YigB (HAD superfamily)
MITVHTGKEETMVNKEIRYVLFDLDGTLLPMDTDEFLGHYLQALALHFAPHIPDPRAFIHQLVLSSRLMIDDITSGKTNREKFADDFFPRIGRNAVELMPMFEDFYNNRYPLLRKHVSPGPLGRELAEAALGRGYKIVLATNPVFPKEAVYHRMSWANVHDLPWELVTSYENSRYCKPHAAYYDEILQKLGARPEECLHIGNDMDEDLAAGSAGIDVVITIDNLINRQERSLSEALHYGGTLAVVQWLKGR